MVALLGVLPLTAQADHEEAFIETLYGKLAASFPAKDGGTQAPPFLVLANPGFAITERDLQDPYFLSVLLDQIPKPARLYASSSVTYSALFGKILESSETSPFQNQRDKHSALLARNLVYDRRRPGKPTPVYASYLKYRAAYTMALDARDIAVAEQRYSGKPLPSGLDQAIDTAQRNWATLGSKGAVDEALATLNAAFDADVGVAFQLMRETFASAKNPPPRSGEQDWWPVLTSPPPAEWLQSDGWTTWSFTPADLAVTAPPATLALASGGQGAVAKLHPQLMQSMTLSVKLKRIAVQRPWLNAAIFSSPKWRLVPTAGLSLIASGHPSDPAPGLMPILVTGVILAKDLVMQATWGKEGPQGEGTGVPKALGPFALTGASQARASTLRSLVYNEQGHLSMRTEGAQIIGFLCQALPKFPSPDPKYFR
jgi:hypothetical protein